MLIDKIPADMWPGQRSAAPTDYADEQQSLRADVALFLKGRFQVVGERIFVIPPDRGIRLMGGPWQTGGPAQFQTIGSEPAYDRRPYVRVVHDPQDKSKTSVTVGETMSGEKIYTAIALHAIPNSDDELIGYFQLDPLITDPAKGL